MKSRLGLAALGILLVASVFLAASCRPAPNQSDLEKAIRAQQKAEDELAQTKKELADAKAEIARLEAQAGKSSGGEAGGGASGTSGGGGGGTGSSGAYTPGKGSATRTAILDSVRGEIGWKGLFKVHSLKVKDGWAYGVLEQSKSGGNYESFPALLHRVGGSWNVVWVGSGADIEDIETKSGMKIEKYLQKKYGAPAEIFS